jgi:lipoate-protein ligase A
MRIVELGECGALSALALEEAVLEGLDAGESLPAWITWTSASPVAVLGTARAAGKDLHQDALRADGVGVLRRRSGGGTVILGASSPAVTLVDAVGGDIRECYGRFCEVLIAALGRLAIEAVFQPPADLAVGEGKVAGLAQRRKRRAALITASVLLGPLAAESEKYLAEPEARDAPEYRKGRRHREFMTSLAALGGAGPDWRAALAAELAARGAVRDRPTGRERSRAVEIEPELAAHEWIYRL